ncbi:class I SAM-dependent methyltransferase [Salmonella enterica subsp. enterica]
MDTFASNNLNVQNESKWEDLHKRSSLEETRTTPSYAICRIVSERNSIMTGNDAAKMHVLEIGCGFGRNLLYLVENEFAGEYTGIDQTEIAIKQSSLTLQKFILSEKIHIMKANAGGDIPFEDETFDCIFDIMSAITFIPEEGARKKYFNNVERLLKPGGAYFFLSVRKEGEVNDKISDPSLGDESLFKRKFDSMIEKSYSSDELKNYLSSLNLRILDVTSEHIRAFGDEIFDRKNGFWFGCFTKAQS